MAGTHSGTIRRATFPAGCPASRAIFAQQIASTAHASAHAFIIPTSQNGATQKNIGVWPSKNSADVVSSAWLFRLSITVRDHRPARSAPTARTRANPMKARCLGCPKLAAAPAPGGARWRSPASGARSKTRQRTGRRSGLPRPGQCVGLPAGSLDHRQFFRVVVFSIGEACHKATTAPASGSGANPMQAWFFGCPKSAAAPAPGGSPSRAVRPGFPLLDRW